MAEKSGFFNARETLEGGYDREYDAEEFAKYFANFISNGVYANPANQLKVVYLNEPEKPFTVVVRKGKAYIDGYWYELTEDMEVIIPPNTQAFVKNDVISCTLNKTERKIRINLKEGVLSDLPENNGTKHELVLSVITLQPNSQRLNVNDIEDKRSDNNYCGFVAGLIEQIDTTELFKQYDDSFKEWFEEIKGQLSQDSAGNLQNQIGILSRLKTKIKDSIVNAINNLYDEIIGKTLSSLEQVKTTTEKGFYVDALAIKELSDKLKLKAWAEDDGAFVIPYQNKCRITSSAIYKSDFTIEFKIEIDMQQPLNVATETIVAIIDKEAYRPKTLLNFPIIEYNYHSISILLVYPNGNISIVIPKGGALQSNFPNGQHLSLRASYPI